MKTKKKQVLITGVSDIEKLYSKNVVFVEMFKDVWGFYQLSIITPEICQDSIISIDKFIDIYEYLNNNSQYHFPQGLDIHLFIKDSNLIKNNFSERLATINNEICEIYNNNISYSVILSYIHNASALRDLFPSLYIEIIRDRFKNKRLYPGSLLLKTMTDKELLYFLCDPNISNEIKGIITEYLNKRNGEK